MGEPSVEQDHISSVEQVIAETLCPPSHREGWVRSIVGQPMESGPRRVCVMHAAMAKNVAEALAERDQRLLDALRADNEARAVRSVEAALDDLTQAEAAPRCVICHGSGWTGSRHACAGSEHYHCSCGAPCGVDRAEGCSGGVRRRTTAEQRVCSQDGCHGDGRYQPPGKGHMQGCEHDPVAWVWGVVSSPAQTGDAQ